MSFDKRKYIEKNRRKIDYVCAIMMFLLGLYYIIALLSVTHNYLYNELRFSIENRSFLVFLHLIFIIVAHVIVIMLFMYSGYGVAKGRKRSKTISMILSLLNLVALAAKENGHILLGLKVIVGTLSICVAILLVTSIFIGKKIKKNY